MIDAWKQVPGAKLVAVADETPLLENAKKDFETSYADWREMLDKHEFDALVVTSDNVESANIAVAALEKGIPCMVEKAMAANAVDADRMLAASKQFGAMLMINWPVAWAPWIQEFKAQIDGDKTGHVFHMRYRNGHWGPKEIGCDQWFVGWLHDEAKNGGGAIADFGSYGAAVARWLFGMPETVYCVKQNTTKDYDVPDDHAILVLRYPKRDVVLEGTWATRAWDTGPNPVAYGKNGTVAVYGNDIKFHGPNGTEDVAAAELPTRNPAVYFMECLASGSQPEGILNAEIAADGVRITDAAIRSNRSGCAERP